MRAFSLTALLVFVLDQASKVWIVQILNLRELLRIDVLPPLLNLRMAWNQGINFGLFSGQAELTRWLLVVLSVGISAAVTIWLVRSDQPRRALIAGGALVGGALGNALDRVFYGAVADFLNLSCCGISNPFSFNVADIAIFAGALGLVLFAGPNKTP